MKAQLLTDDRYHPKSTGISVVMNARDPNDPLIGLALLWRGREVVSVWVKKLTGDLIQSRLTSVVGEMSV